MHTKSIKLQTWLIVAVVLPSPGQFESRCSGSSRTHRVEACTVCSEIFYHFDLFFCLTTGKFVVIQINCRQVTALWFLVRCYAANTNESALLVHVCINSHHQVAKSSSPIVKFPVSANYCQCVNITLVVTLQQNKI